MTTDTKNASRFYSGVRSLIWCTVGRYVRFEIEGEEYAPKEGGVILVSNHLGIADTVLIPMYLDTQVAFVAKAELFRFPPLRRLMYALGAIKLLRSGATHEDKKTYRQEVENALSAGRIVGIFPEGTRSKCGLLGPFHKGTGVLARSLSVKVYPVGVSYPNWRTVRLSFAPPVEGSEFMPRELTAQLRKTISELSGQEMA